MTILQIEELNNQKELFLNNNGYSLDQLFILEQEYLKFNKRAISVKEWYNIVDQYYQTWKTLIFNNDDVSQMSFEKLENIPFTFEEMLKNDFLTFEEYKAKKIKDNWELVNDFQKKRLSDGGLSYCMIMKVQLQNQKCIDNCNWADNLWKQYYQTKYLINISTTKEEIDSLPLATLNIPELPWGLDVIMAEIDG